MEASDCDCKLPADQACSFLPLRSMMMMAECRFKTSITACWRLSLARFRECVSRSASGWHVDEGNSDCALFVPCVCLSRRVAGTEPHHAHATPPRSDSKPRVAVSVKTAMTYLMITPASEPSSKSASLSHFVSFLWFFKSGPFTAHTCRISLSLFLPVEVILVTVDAAQWVRWPSSLLADSLWASTAMKDCMRCKCAQRWRGAWGVQINEAYYKNKISYLWFC